MTRYVPGDWYAVVTPAGVAVLPPDVPLGTVERVWMDLRAGGGLAALIDGLVGAFGSSLARLPEFGVIAISSDGEVRVALRGQVKARLWVVGDTEAATVSGSGVTTWNERVWTGVGRAELAVGDAEGLDSLPVVDGVLRAQLLHVAVLDFDTQPQEMAQVALPGEGASGGSEPPEDTNAQHEPEWSEQSMPPSVVAARAATAVINEPVAPAESAGPTGPGLPEVMDVAAAAPAAGHEGGSGVSESAATILPIVAPAADPAGLGVGEDVDPAPASIGDSAQGAGHSQGETTLMEPADPDPDPASDYDRLLFGETMISSAEAAAVRVLLAEEDPPAAGPPPVPPVVQGPPASVEERYAAPADLPPMPPPLAAGLISGLPSFGSPPPPPPLAPVAQRQGWQAPPPPPPAPSPVDQRPSNQSWNDHDGETVLVDDLRVAAQAARDAAVQGSVRHPLLLVPGHPPMTLDRSVIVGSRPRLNRVQGGSVPHLLTVQGPNGEVSRSHAEIRVEHSAVLVVDLDSTNGTILARIGADPFRLHPGEAYILVSGDQLDLGDGVVLGFEGLS